MTTDQTTSHPLATGRYYLLATDGACKGNPGRGGWGVLIQLREGNTVLRQSASAAWEIMTTTNIRMEMTAAIEGLRKLKEPSTPAVVLSDNQMLISGMTEWLEGWKAKGWKASKGKVQNRDLWEQLDELAQSRPVGWVKVAGHAGHDLNEIADHLASNAALGRYPNGARSVRSKHPEWFL